MRKESIWKRHSLSIVAAGVLLLWFLSYLKSDPESHLGVLFGNAIADWTGVVIAVLATKWLFERGSSESRPARRKRKNPVLEFLHEHSLTLFLVATALLWTLLFFRADPGSRWGTVAGNLVSEWSQQLGMVLLTKELIESRSKESRAK